MTLVKMLDEYAYVCTSFAEMLIDRQRNARAQGSIVVTMVKTVRMKKGTSLRR